MRKTEARTLFLLFTARIDRNRPGGLDPISKIYNTWLLLITAYRSRRGQPKDPQTSYNPSFTADATTTLLHF